MLSPHWKSVALAFTDVGGPIGGSRYFCQPSVGALASQRDRKATRKHVPTRKRFTVDTRERPPLIGNTGGRAQIQVLGGLSQAVVRTARSIAGDTASKRPQMVTIYTTRNPSDNDMPLPGFFGRARLAICGEPGILPF